MALFGLGRRARPGDADRRRIAALAREAAALDERVVVRVNEIVCPDPACPGLETVILVMRPGERTSARRIAKPAAEVTPEDVRAAFIGSAEP